jgi:hypothetical protein
MTGTPRPPWTAEQDKELQALIFSASRVETIAEALNRNPLGGPSQSGRPAASTEKDYEATQPI